MTYIYKLNIHIHIYVYFSILSFSYSFPLKLITRHWISCNIPVLYSFLCYIIVVESISRVQTLATPWTAACQAPLFFTISQSLLKFMSIESVMFLTISSSAPPFSSCPQTFPASGSFPMSRLFTSRAKGLEVQLQHQSSKIYSGVISFRIHWFDLLPDKGTLKSSSAPQFENFNSSALKPSLWSNSHIHTRKRINLTYGVCIC